MVARVLPFDFKGVLMVVNMLSLVARVLLYVCTAV